jgi:hypothetical protein
MPMTAEQCDQVVNALATLIVERATGHHKPRRHGAARSFRWGLTSRHNGGVPAPGPFGSNDRDERP